MATTYNIVVEQGDDIEFTITVTDGVNPLPISAFRMDVKKQIADVTPLFSFNTTGLTIEIDPDGDIGEEPITDEDVEATTSSNVVTVSIDRSFTFLPAIKAGGQFLYDGFVEFVNGKRRKVLSGTIQVNKSVTQWSA